MKKTIALLSVLVMIISTSVMAQNEVLREINSLNGISSFGVVVNVEKSGSMDEIDFNLAAIKKELISRLSDIPIRIVSDKQRGSTDQVPILMLHINIMHSGENIYPYASDLTFYQPVKLSLNKDLGSMAITWQRSFVGVVSGDMMKVVPESSIDLIDDFIRDYKSVNL